MSEKTPKNKSQQTDSRQAHPPTSGVWTRLKSIFKKGDLESATPRVKPAAPKPSKALPRAKKGSTRFMKSFEVKAVGKEREGQDETPSKSSAEPSWAGEIGQSKAAPQSKQTEKSTKEASVQKTGAIKPQSKILIPDEKPESASPLPPQSKETTKPIQAESVILKPDTDKLKQKETAKQKSTGPIQPESTVLLPVPGETESTPVKSDKISKQPGKEEPSSKAEEAPQKLQKETGSIKPQSVVLSPDTDKIKKQETAKQKGTGPIDKTGQILPESTVLVPLPGEIEKTPTQTSAKAAQSKESSKFDVPAIGSGKASSTGRVRPQSILLAPDTDKIDLKKLGIAKDTGKVTSGSESAKIPPATSGPAAKPPVLLGKEENRQAGQGAASKPSPSTHESRPGAQTVTMPVGKQTQQVPPGLIKPETKSQADQPSIVPVPSLKPPSGAESKDKPGAVISETKSDQPEFGSASKTSPDLKKETMKRLIPVPEAKKITSKLLKDEMPLPPKTIPTPPPGKKTSNVAKESLTSQINIKGMVQPPPPPIVSKPETKPLAPLLKSKDTKGNIKPQSIVIRPDTSELKPKEIEPKKKEPSMEEASSKGIAKTPTPAVESATETKKPKTKPSTGPVKPESIMLSPDTDEIKTKTGAGAKPGSISTQIKIKGVIPPPVSSQEKPKPSLKPVVPTLKVLPQAKSETGPLQPSSIVIKPDTGKVKGKDAPPIRPEKAIDQKPVSAPKPPVLATTKPKLIAKAKPEPKAKAEPSLLKNRPKPKAVAQTEPSRTSITGRRRSPEATAPVAKTKRRGTGALVKGGLIAALLLLIGIGVYFFALYDETQLIVQVQEGPRQLEPRVQIVLNIAGKLEIIRQEYRKRLKPIDEEIAEFREYLADARADLAGSTQKLSLLEDALDQYQSDIPRYLEENEKKLNDLWENKSDTLEQKYENSRNEILTEIQSRSQSLGVDYQPNEVIDAIPVAINAYRLALYGRSDVADIESERAWAESVLKAWNTFEEEWRDEQKAIRKQALKLKKEPASKIAEAKRASDSLVREIGAVELDLKIVSSEVTRYETMLAEAEERKKNAIPPFLDEIGRVPDDFQVAEYPLGPGNLLTARNLQDSERLKEGDFFILVQAREGDDRLWAVKPVTINPKETNEISIGPADFKSFNEILSSQQDVLLTLLGQASTL
ncbi:MAG: hypothetical protein AAFY98_06985 [Verrucomicrobiota bacterium]